MIPVSRELLADTLTPVSAYLRIRGRARSAFLLESVEGGERVARWSFLGRDPYLVLRGRGRGVERVSAAGVETIEKDFFAALREETRRVTPVAAAGLPPFSGGGVGFLAYDAVRLIEKIPDRHGGSDDSLGEFHFFGTVLAFDHVRHRIHVITNVFVDGETGTPERAYRDAQRRLDEVEELLTRETAAFPPLRRSGGAVEPVANFTKEGFCDAVVKAKEYIRKGDIFQIVLSQRFRLPVTADPFTVYRALRAMNPSPYLFFFESCDEEGDLAVLGSSPETLVKVAQRRVYVRPIAGTRPRGANEEEDRRLEAELLADEKELAEHRMLVDLGRHDVGRVAKYGTVRWPELMVVERYSHVMHIVSNVEGMLQDGMTNMDVLRATFPAGTLTGAPKVHAMELIDQLEPVKRGIYGGACGYLSYAGDMDVAIAIRTGIVKDGTLYVQAAAGVVADSVPELEWRETEHKARALLRAAELVEEGLE